MERVRAKGGQRWSGEDWRSVTEAARAKERRKWSGVEEGNGRRASEGESGVEWKR